MPTFNQLTPDDQDRVVKDVNRFQTIVIDALADIGRRGVIYVAVLLIGSTASLAVLMPRSPVAVLPSIALGCLILGILSLGVYFALNFDFLRRLTNQWSWARFNLLASKVDVGVLIAPPQEPKLAWIITGLVYLASAFWLVGVALAFIAYERNDFAPAGQMAPLTINPAIASAPLPLALAKPQPPPELWSRKDWFDAGTIIFLALQAGVLYFTLTLSRRTARRQLRAYVFPYSFTLFDGRLLTPPDPNLNDVPVIALEIRNSGATPAYKVVLAYGLDVIDRINEHQLINPILVERDYSVLGPNVGSTSRRWYNRALTPAEITDIQNGVKAIYLYGRIEYRDAFKSRKKRFTTFRLHYVGLFPPASPSAFTFSTNGNDADQ